MDNFAICSWTEVFAMVTNIEKNLFDSQSSNLIIILLQFILPENDVTICAKVFFIFKKAIFETKKHQLGVILVRLSTLCDQTSNDS